MTLVRRRKKKQAEDCLLERKDTLWDQLASLQHTAELSAAFTRHGAIPWHVAGRGSRRHSLALRLLVGARVEQRGGNQDCEEREVFHHRKKESPTTEGGSGGFSGNY
jgi:hypothetical protein